MLFGSLNVGAMGHLGYSILGFQNKEPLGNPGLHLLIARPCSSSLDHR